MSRLRPLHGACNCGRNHYSIIVPEDSTERAQVYFDDSSDSRRSQATPLTAWLRIPLPWFSSSTQALFPDETHTSIRRTFTSPHAPHCQRIFCGYCGTHLSYWSEQPPSEAEYLNITLGSLLNEDLKAIQDLDLLPENSDSSSLQSETDNDESGVVSSQSKKSPITHTLRSGSTGGLSWFEELLDGSRLGRTQHTRRGHGVSADGTTTVEWEISEYLDDGTETVLPPHPTSRSKRKLADAGGEESEDVKMRG